MNYKIIISNWSYIPRISLKLALVALIDLIFDTIFKQHGGKCCSFLLICTESKKKNIHEMVLGETRGSCLMFIYLFLLPLHNAFLPCSLIVWSSLLLSRFLYSTSFMFYITPGLWMFFNLRVFALQMFDFSSTMTTSFGKGQHSKLFCTSVCLMLWLDGSVCSLKFVLHCFFLCFTVPLLSITWISSHLSNWTVVRSW